MLRGKAEAVSTRAKIALRRMFTDAGPAAWVIHYWNLLDLRLLRAVLDNEHMRETCTDVRQKKESETYAKWAIDLWNYSQREISDRWIWYLIASYLMNREMLL